MISTHNMWLIALILTVHICPVVLQKRSYCPPAKFGNDVALDWTADLATLAFGCITQYTELNCCAQGYKSLLWYQKRNDQWEPVWTNYQRYFENDNQTITIEAADVGRDEGDYKCVATDHTGKSISNDVELQLQECPNWHESPVIFQPENGTRYEHFPGDNINISCSAFFGNCKKSVFIPCYIDWLKMYANGSSSIIYEGNSSNRVYVKRNIDYRSTGQRNVLHIHDIKKQDYGYYRCWAYSTNGSPVKRDIYIAMKHHPLPWNAIIPSICVGVLLGVFSLSMYLWYEKGLDIKLMYKDRYMRRTRDEAEEFDAAILYTEDSAEDSEFVENTLWRTLTDETLGYRIFISRDNIGYNESVWNAYGKAEEKSHCFIFIISPHFFNDRMCVNFFHQTVAAEFRNFIFVVFKRISNEEQAQLCRDNPDDQLDMIFTAMKVGRTLEWPKPNENGEQSKKKLDLFWKKLRYELPPKVEEEEQQNVAADNNQPNVQQPDDIEAQRGQPENGRAEIRKNRVPGNRHNLNSDSGRPLLCSTESQNVENEDILPQNEDILPQNEDILPENNVVANNIVRNNVGEGDVAKEIGPNNNNDQVFEASGESGDTGIGPSIPSDGEKSIPNSP